ncbi:recombinase family protein [Dasania sp. GY-MA-18]|uniref:Recombinase family protein n=1 Tax=Dasania phycosphaerae TaxID=2950436 RepID=A0A9J6RMC3_9GAMM|nr:MULTISPECIES: recombinase family protein [Dasania]MCR8923188.1 recombinase family protein [Dasania sp. GY-MA-18]MCZ0865620.1 recombinase family protein [Dasania phycosphaerae]MCZ0869345.1 recombinase family protein [Dasania phycosphaerae]
MAIIAYYRVSTKEQTIENQRLELKTLYNIDHEYSDEAVSGSVKGKDREGFAAMLSFIRKGDTLVTVDLDRLGRDSIDVQQNIASLKDKGVNIIITRLGIDLSTDAGELLVTIMSKVAEMERRKTMERAEAGRRRAIAEGKHMGRKPSVDHTKVKELRASGLSIAKTAETLGVSTATIKRMQAKS